ncbi:MAG: hypothetical protein AAGN35_13960 [Bacteroidota bacterium]
MIEIIVIIFVVRAFTGLAGRKNLNKIVWGFIGALSYYIPVLLMGFVILPPLIESGTFGYGYGAIILSVVLSIAVGAITCVIAYQVLKNQDGQPDPNASDSPFDLDGINRDLK